MWWVVKSKRRIIHFKHNIHPSTLFVIIVNIFKDTVEQSFIHNPPSYNLKFEFSLESNLLIVGNGFDLEHGLKTQYTDFFDVIDKKAASKNEIILNNNKYLIKDNNLLLYLLEEYKQNKLQGNNWIDIETELKKIISLICICVLSLSLFLNN